MISTLDEIIDMVEFHFKHTKYWRKYGERNKISNRDIAAIDGPEDLYYLLGPQPEEVLREDPKCIQPPRTRLLRFGGERYLSTSSGTKGERKGVMWCDDSNLKFFEYTKKFFDWFQNKYGKVTGAFMGIYTSDLMHEHMKGIARILGVDFFGLQVDSFKVKEYLARGEVEKVAVKLESIIYNIRHSELWMDPPPQLALIAPLPHLLEALPDSVEFLILGGINITSKVVEELQQKYKAVVGEFGHHMLGASWGPWEPGEILTYYPNYPWVTFLVVDEMGEIVKYGKEGDLVYVRIGWDFFWIGKEGDRATRIQKKKPFGWDGIKNPYRAN